MSENIKFGFEYHSPVKIEIAETSQGIAIVRGTLLAEGVSRNGNLYTIDEMENIAAQAEGKPIYFGTKAGINPNTGTYCNHLHDDSESHQIGRILKTIMDKAARKIYFIAEVANTDEHPDIITMIKKGWGVSIGGFVNKVKYVKTAANKICRKIENMVVEHLSIFQPDILRGMDAAKVEDVSIQESFIGEEYMIFETVPENVEVSYDFVFQAGEGTSIKQIMID